MSENNITTAVISRFMTIDLPYYSQWLEYYDKLGFDYFYLYYIDDYFEEDLEKVLTYFPKDKIQIIKVDKNKIYPNAVFKKILLNIKEEYVFNVDSDEFLYLGGMNIKQFLNKFKKFNYFRFNWLMAPSLSEKNNSLNDILFDKKSPKYFLVEYKSLSKTKFINFKNTKTPHNFVIKPNFRNNIKKFESLKLNKKINNIKNKFFIIHFCYRDMLDCFYKQLSQTLFLVKDKTINYFFNDTITFKSMPKRFLVYFSEIINKNQKINNININLNLTTSINNDYLLNTLKHKLNNKLILNKYVERINFLMQKFTKFNFFLNFKIHKSAKLEILQHFKKIHNFYIKFENNISSSFKNLIDENDIHENNNNNYHTTNPIFNHPNLSNFENNLNNLLLDKPIVDNLLSLDDFINNDNLLSIYIQNIKNNDNFNEDMERNLQDDNIQSLEDDDELKQHLEDINDDDDDYNINYDDNDNENNNNNDNDNDDEVESLEEGD